MQSRRRSSSSASSLIDTECLPSVHHHELSSSATTDTGSSRGNSHATTTATLSSTLVRAGSRKFPQLSIDTTEAQSFVEKSNDHHAHHNRDFQDVTILNNNENDTPVPTPPPPPNSFKLPLHLHHHYHYGDENDDMRLTDPLPSTSLGGSCLIHSQSSQSSLSQYSHLHGHHSHHSHYSHHKRKRRHRDSKRNRLRFSFRSKNAIAVSSMIVPAPSETSIPPPPPPSSMLHSLSSYHQECDHHHHIPHSFHHHHIPTTRASSITSSTSDQSLSSNLLQQPQPQTSSRSESMLDITSRKPNGGLRSKKLKTLIHPLDRSIVGIFMLTIFFTILALLTGAPTVLFLLLILPIFIFLKKLFQCHFSSIPNHEPVSSVDSYWLQKGHITHCLLYMDQGLSIQQLRDVITTRLLTKPELARFKSRLVYKGLSRAPYWKYEPELDNLDDHIIEDDPIDCKRSLRKRLIGFMSQALPMDKPLWQIRYMQATFCDQVILIVRVHQTLSQSGLVSILTHYLCDSVPMCSAQKPRFGSSTLSINMLRAIIVGPLTFFLWIMWAFTRRHHNYLTKAKEIKSIHWSSFDLPKIFRIKQVTRSTLNDVLLASIAGSIRAYLTTKTNIINPPDLTVSIPVDIKPNTPIESSLIGINYVLTSSPIPTNTEGAIPRLWEVRHLMEELKTSADTAVMYGSHYLLSRFLPTTLYRLLMNLVNRNSSIYMSNMIGPEQSLSIGSHRLNKVYYFLSPPSYCSIVYNIFSYDQKLYISISTSSKLITSAKELMRQFRAQIDILHELLSKRRVPGESKRAKRPMYLSENISSAPHPLSTGQQPFTATQPSPSTAASFTPSNDFTAKLHEIQDELNSLSDAYEMGDPDVVQRYEELKEEFTTLLYEMRRRKSLADYGSAVSNIVINIEDSIEDDENDGELRILPPRRFSVVSIGRRASIVSSLPSTSRVTPPILSRRSMATSPEPPSSPEVAFKVETEC